MKSLLVASMMWTVAMSVAAQSPPTRSVIPPVINRFEQVRSMDRKQEPTHGTVFLNAPAATVTTAGQPYPFGSVVIMEWRKGGKDGEVARLDVMRKERGYGAAYGADKNGDWEYASYSPDGKLITDAAASLACAQVPLEGRRREGLRLRGRFARLNDIVRLKPDSTGTCCGVRLQADHTYKILRR